jgi:hypothetical protein
MLDALVVYKGSNAESQLVGLGLDMDSLLEVVHAGERARAEATRFDPINAGGWDAYRYRVRAFREIYEPRGWQMDHSGGLERTWSPDRTNVVLTRGGDAGVGCPLSFPRLRRTGNELRAMVETQPEPHQPMLNPQWLNRPRPPVVEEAFTTWLLLVNYDEARGLVRSELSAPTGLDPETDAILGWSRRIILSEIHLLDLPPAGAEVPVTVEVPIMRKR